MISQTAEYALRAIVHLAERPDESRTARQIAEATRVPLAYLSKVLQSLSRAGLIASQRGLHGGFTLLRRADELTVLEVVDAVDPLPRILRCPLGIEAHGAHLCPLHRRLDDAVAHIEQSFRSTAVADLLEEPNDGTCRCAALATREPAGVG